MTKCSVCLTVLTQMRHLTHCLLCDLSWWSSSWARLGNSRPHCPHLCSIVQYSTVQYSTVLVGAFSVIVQLDRLIVYSTSHDSALKTTLG